MNNNFKILSLFRRLTMPLPELEAYYREKRDQEKDKEIKHIGTKRFFSHMLRFALFINRLCEKRKYVIIDDKRIINNKARVYACTHVGEIDGLVAYEAYKDQAYWFWGDVGDYYKKLDYFLVSLNGAIAVDTWDKRDRQNALNTAIKVLKKKSNVMIFPEGTWNITENKPVMHLYTGSAQMALESGADIIPVAIELYGDTYYINIGENISREKYDPNMKRELTDDLRDAMATLKWEIFEKYGHIRRDELPDNASEQWLENYQKVCDAVNFPMEVLVRSIYVTKEDKEQREVQTVMEHLIPSRANAFLFSKRNRN